MNSANVPWAVNNNKTCQVCAQLQSVITFTRPKPSDKRCQKLSCSSSHQTKPWAMFDSNRLLTYWTAARTLSQVLWWSRNMMHTCCVLETPAGHRSRRQKRSDPVRLLVPCRSNRPLALPGPAAETAPVDIIRLLDLLSQFSHLWVAALTAKHPCSRRDRCPGEPRTSASMERRTAVASSAAAACCVSAALRMNGSEKSPCWLPPSSALSLPEQPWNQAVISAAGAVQVALSHTRVLVACRHRTGLLSRRANQPNNKSLQS